MNKRTESAHTAQRSSTPPAKRKYDRYKFERDAAKRQSVPGWKPDTGGRPPKYEWFDVASRERDEMVLEYDRKRAARQAKK